MKFSRILGAFAVLVVALAACTTQPSGEKFGFKTGDYTVYDNVALDSANRPTGAVTRSSRKVIKTGVSIGGQTDAVLVVDTLFAATRSIDSTYYRVANDEVFVYFDTGFIGSVTSSLGSLGATTIRGFEPKWVKLADLKDAAGTSNFPSVTFSVSTDVAILGTLNITVEIVGSNLGRVSLSLNNTTYQVHRQSQITTVATTLLGARLSVPVTVEYDFGIPSTGAPRTILRTESKTTSIAIPLLGNQVVPGNRSTLVSFTSGTTL